MGFTDDPSLDAGFGPEGERICMHN
jgi:hypothetical protein